MMKVHIDVILFHGMNDVDVMRNVGSYLVDQGNVGTTKRQGNHKRSELIENPIKMSVSIQMSMILEFISFQVGVVENQLCVINLSNIIVNDFMKGSNGESNGTILSDQDVCTYALA